MKEIGLCSYVILDKTLCCFFSHPLSRPCLFVIIYLRIKTDFLCACSLLYINLTGLMMHFCSQYCILLDERSENG